MSASPGTIGCSAGSACSACDELFKKDPPRTSTSLPWITIGAAGAVLCPACVQGILSLSIEHQALAAADATKDRLARKGLFDLYAVAPPAPPATPAAPMGLPPGLGGMMPPMGAGPRMGRPRAAGLTPEVRAEIGALEACFKNESHKEGCTCADCASHPPCPHCRRKNCRNPSTLLGRGFEGGLPPTSA